MVHLGGVTPALLTTGELKEQEVRPSKSFSSPAITGVTKSTNTRLVASTQAQDSCTGPESSSTFAMT